MCPLTRITSTIIVPPKKPISAIVFKKTPPISNTSRKLKDITNIGSSSKSKNVESKISNNLEPNKNWGSNVSTAPSSSRVHFRSFKSSFGTWTRVDLIVTTCYTQNRSLNKTPYELIHDRKPDLTYFHVFGALCYPTNDGEDLGKMKPKADIGIFVGYTPAKKAYRIYNKRTRLIIETIHVEFDELTSMASEQFDSRLELQLMTPRRISLGLKQNPPSTTPYVPPTKNDWDLLFQPMLDEYFNPPLSVVSLIPTATAPRPFDPIGSPSSTSIDQVVPSTSTDTPSSSLMDMAYWLLESLIFKISPFKL
ncbi:retrovirus-related pol polyprotein from transposon TNT 1-94 [Tanacetum coccineum]